MFIRRRGGRSGRGGVGDGRGKSCIAGACQQRALAGAVPQLAGRTGRRVDADGRREGTLHVNHSEPMDGEPGTAIAQTPPALAPVVAGSITRLGVRGGGAGVSVRACAPRRCRLVRSRRKKSSLGSAMLVGRVLFHWVALVRALHTHSLSLSLARARVQIAMSIK